MKIYGDSRSGNCLKVKYVCDFLKLPYEWEELDVLSGVTRTREFLAKNPAGQIPTVLFDDGRMLAQSNAIMRYLARGSSLIPSDEWEQAKMDEWLFWEQYSHEPAIAVVRFLVALKGTPLKEIDPNLIKKGDAALDRLEKRLSKHDYLVGDALSLADIALLAYTQFAEEGGFSLDGRPAIKRWLARVKAGLTG
ncbi:MULTISPECIES: glutathione S-transferase family protein [Kordiimonas]|jgi:glutathione S-transferase|uniref:glutathione S-transferase family protein n=1 Tax=Kordiimonas TaxID=288021 RepID=UPI00257DBE41|nr:glutathione S-transferase family protein [Kordiimonas sp. UBA4487]